MSEKQNNIEKQNNGNTHKKPNSKFIFATIGAIVGILVAFLTGSSIFYQVGRDSLSNKCEGEKIVLSKEIDSLKKNNLRIYKSIELLQNESVEFCKDKDSLNKIIDNQNSIINEFKKNNFAQINKLIKEGDMLLLNTESIETWRNNCITFLTRNSYRLLTEFKKKTNYTHSDIGQRKGAIEDGINILQTIK